MPSWSNASPSEPAKVPLHGFRLLVEPEPWRRIFLRNLADLFRGAPPPAWVSSKPGPYWADALVHRPVAWKFMQVSLLGHILALASVIGAGWLWQDEPVVLGEALPKTNTILHYQVSEYLPQVHMRPSEDKPPVRRFQQEADPELAPQKIVALNADHTSTRQTIVQPNPTLLRQDVPMPNIVAWTVIPGAPLAARHPLTELPAAAPQVVAPAQQVLEHNPNQLTFPLPAQPAVVAPAGPMAMNAALPISIMAMAGAVVIAPAPDAAQRDPGSLQLPAQAPPQVVAPASAIASARMVTRDLSGSAPQVVPPAPDAGRRELGELGVPGAGQNVAPPSQPVTAGTSLAPAREMGQLLALNARPAPPSGPLRVPEGNRKGEFTAGPEGHAGASGAPETRKGDPSPASGSGDSGEQASVYVSAPPTKVTGAVVVASAAPLPRGASTDVPSTDSIENRVFGARRNYGMRLSMPNLASAIGSWSVRFAELNPNPESPGEIIAPEAVRKVDPSYPAALLHDRVEGVVVLHAVIHSDGSVGDVRVLEGFNAQLDANACAALERWRFRPGLKNGVPIDVEAVIRVPFRVRQTPF